VLVRRGGPVREAQHGNLGGDCQLWQVGLKVGFGGLFEALVLILRYVQNQHSKATLEQNRCRSYYGSIKTSESTIPRPKCDSFPAGLQTFARMAKISVPPL
jgi:hypothetical protein